MSASTSTVVISKSPRATRLAAACKLSTCASPFTPSPLLVGDEPYYARFGFGDGSEPLYFERLLLPLASDGGNQATHLVGLAFLIATRKRTNPIGWILLVATDDAGEVVGFALNQWKWSSLRGERTVVMDDLFVAESARGAGACQPAPGLVARLLLRLPDVRQRADAPGEAGPSQRTPNLAAVVQEVVDRPGWASGNALAIMVTVVAFAVQVYSTAYMRDDPRYGTYAALISLFTAGIIERFFDETLAWAKQARTPSGGRVIDAAGGRGVMK